MPEVENKPKNLVKNRSPQGHFEGQDTIPLRRIVGVSRRDKMRHIDIRRKAGVEDDIVLKITRRRMRYFGHVVRMPPSRFPNMAFYGRVQGQRSRGRPRMRWVDNLEKGWKE